MRLVYALTIALALAAGWAWAEDLVMIWDPAPGATAYDIEFSSNLNPVAGTGAWSVLKADLAPATICTGTPVTCTYTVVNAQAGNYVQTPKNSGGSLSLKDKSIAYCPACKGIAPPTKPKYVGVQQGTPVGQDAPAPAPPQASGAGARPKCAPGCTP